MKMLIAFLIACATVFGQCSSLTMNPVTGLLDCIGSSGGGSGTVTSVGLAGTANQITVTGASPITTSGSWTLSFPAGGVTLPGATNMSGLAYSNPTALTVPADPVITQGGTPGAATYKYQIARAFHGNVGNNSNEVTTTTGNATLSGSNYNIVTFGACTGAQDAMAVWRTFPSNLSGFIGFVACGTTFLNDTGITRDSWSYAPGVDTSTVFAIPGFISFGNTPYRNGQDNSCSGIACGGVVNINNSFTDGTYYKPVTFVAFYDPVANMTSSPVGFTTITQNNSDFTTNALSGGVSEVNTTGTGSYKYGITGFRASVIADSSGNYDSDHTFGIYPVRAVDAAVQIYGGTASKVTGVWSWVGLYGGTVDHAYSFYARMPSTGATISSAVYQYYTEAIGGVATNVYPFWADEQGVYRIRADNTFDSVYQAIPALYNPQFTKYTPGAANYERIVQQWNGNVAEIGTEKGGTGTLRDVRLLGANIQIGAPLKLNADVVNPLQFAKNTQSATAPGASVCSLRWAAGTNAGTGKLLAACGTSATEVTIVDNVGGSF